MTPPTKLSLKIPMPRPEFFHHHKKARPSRLLPTPEEVEPVGQLEREECRASDEDSATREAKEWIESMIRTSGRWDNHLSIIRIDCPYTTAELLELGRLPQPEGVRECRQMVRAPVIYDEIGCFLWERLAEMERGPNFRDEDEEREAEYAREMRMKMTLANLDERFLFETTKCAPDGRGVPAELASREAAPNPALANLEDRFLFDTPKYAAGDKDRARQDSGSVSPTEVQLQQPQPQPQPSSQARISRRRGSPPACRPPHSPKACHFCGHDSICESTDALDEVRPESLGTTRGRLGSLKPRRAQDHHQGHVPAPVPAPASTAPHGQSSPAGSSSSSSRAHSRRSSHASTMPWHRDCATRSHSLTKVAHVVGNLGKNVGSTLGHGLSHGYGYGGGGRGRAGSAGTL